MSSRVPLRSLVSSYIGGGWGKDEIDDSHPESAYVIRGTDLADAECGAVNSIPYRFHKTSNLASRRLEPNEIVMEVSGGSIGQPVGRVMFVDEHVLGSLDGPVMCASFCKRVVPAVDAVHPPYLYWYLQAVYASGLIERYQVQSTGIRNLQFEYLLDDLPVHLPPRDEQERAVAALEAMLESLRLNRRRIEILGELARLIYREWFVHLRFPGHEDVELVGSDLGPIPEGWKQATLASVATVNARNLKKGDDVGEILYVDISSVGPRTMEPPEAMPFSDAPGRARRVVSADDTIWSTVRPNRRSHVLLVDPPANLVCSTGFAVLTPNSVPASFLFEMTSTDEFTAHLSGLATGSAYPAVRPPDFECFAFAQPPSALLTKFNEVVGPMHHLQHTLAEQNKALAEARDLLLPRLISGELDVSDLEADLDSVA